MYAAAQIAQWMAISQPLARIGEANKLRKGDYSADVNLDIKLYNTRKDIEYAIAQNADADILYSIANFGYSLCGQYVFAAQAATGSGGSVTPVNPTLLPDKIEFEVSVSSFIAAGATSKQFPSSWIGFDILFNRNNIPQSVINQGSVYYSWDKATATLNLLADTSPFGAAQLTEIFQFYPQL